MGKLIVVQKDKVEGTDTHNVSGTGTDNSSGTPVTVSFNGTAKFDYKGSMTDELSDFVNIDGKPAALITSKSSLDPGESSSGGHGAANAKNIVVLAPPTATAPQVTTINDAVGTGKPSAGAGSSFVKVGGDAVLLDGDKIDTCDGLQTPMNSTVTAGNQDFVSCSE